MTAPLKWADMPRDLIDLWKHFCRQNPLYDSPFYWPQFTRAVASTRDDVRIALIRRGGDVVGFLPYHLTRSRTGKPIGGQINDYQGPIMAPGNRIAPGELLKSAAISSYDYNHLPCAFEALAVDAHTESFSPRMDLADGYAACVARKSSSWKRASKLMRRRARRTEEELGPLRFTFHDASDAVFHQHWHMKNQLLERVGTGFRIGEDWIGATIDRLRDEQGPEFAGVMSTLHAGDTLIAAHFGIRSANVWHYWFSSYDLELARLGPGINLVNHCAMAAQDHGITAIDFGRGDADYKLLFADQQVALCEGSVARRGSLARLVRDGMNGLVAATERLPMGRYQTLPRRAASRLVAGVSLSANPPSHHGSGRGAP